MPILHIADRVIEYTLLRKPHKRHVTLTVDPHRGLRVSAPTHVTDANVEQILREKSSWVIRKLEECERLRDSIPHHRFVSGESFPFLGQHYPLQVLDDPHLTKPSLQLMDNRFLLRIPPHTAMADESQRVDSIRQQFRQWYIETGEAVVRDRLERYTPYFGRPTRIILKDQKSRWGSCAVDGTIRINWRILMAPMPIVDYLLVHELAHLRHRNHSPAFWAAVSAVIPDCRERRSWLRHHGHQLTL
jgi:predicted metal-dependent hydrolase